MQSLGLQQKTSTYMAIVNVTKELTKSIDNKYYSIGVFINLAKAFDTSFFKPYFKPYFFQSFQIIDYVAHR